jgi:hypothetical protein
MEGKMVSDKRVLRKGRQDENVPENLGQTIRATKGRPAKPGKPENKGRGR